MTRSPAELEPRAVARPGSWSACLYLSGDDSRKDAPIWQCSHRHEDEGAAQACAHAEMARRAT